MDIVLKANLSTSFDYLNNIYFIQNNLGFRDLLPLLSSTRFKELQLEIKPYFFKLFREKCLQRKFLTQPTPKRYWIFLKQTRIGVTYPKNKLTQYSRNFQQKFSRKIAESKPLSW